jgi:accessory colonization factor AcfC
MEDNMPNEIKMENITRNHRNNASCRTSFQNVVKPNGAKAIKPMSQRPNIDWLVILNTSANSNGSIKAMVNTQSLLSERLNLSMVRANTIKLIAMKA